MRATDETLPLIDARLADVGLDATTDVRLDATIRADRVLPTRPADAPHTLPILKLGDGPSDASGSGGPDMLVRRTLGEGGMGTVLLAHQRSLERDVAIKTVAVTAPAVLRAALVSEALLTGALEHPVIPPVYALARADDGRPLLVMKRIEGVAWSALLGDDDHPGWMAMGERASDRLVAHLGILQRVADALEYAHDRGVLHRDIKPDNVMVATSGEPYLVDWGIAVRTADAVAPHIQGTPSFMAPEMVVGRPLDARTDVYLLGATLHFVLTRAPRHGGRTLAEVLANATESAPFAYGPDAPAELTALANLATSADPGARPASARAFRHAIDAYLAHRSAAAIADAAIDRLAQLEAALEARRDPADPALARFATEALFGLTEATRLWPDGEIILAGLARARRAAIHLELRRKNADAARALLGDAKDPAIEAEIDALEAAMRDRAREEARLVTVARDANPDVAFRTLRRRAAPAILGLQVILCATQLVAWDMPSTSRAGPGLIVLAVVFVGLASLYALRTRRDDDRNALGARMTLAPIALTVVVLLHRTIAWQAGESVAEILRGDLLLLGTGLVVAGLIAVRPLLAGAALCFTTALAIHFAPAYARWIAHGGVTIIGLAVAVSYLWSTRRRA